MKTILTAVLLLAAITLPAMEKETDNATVPGVYVMDNGNN